MNDNAERKQRAIINEQRRQQAIMDAAHRTARLQAARRHEEGLFAGAEQFVLTIDGFFRRLRKTTPTPASPIPLPAVATDHESATEREAA